MRRRDLITLLAGAAAWPLAARAQQAAMPVIGFLNPQSPEVFAEPLRGFHHGLKDAGYSVGDVAIEFRWADNQVDRLAALAAELVRKQVAVIVTTGGIASAYAAKAATSTIPIVFSVGDDPVRHGLVPSLSRPGGNLTGVNFHSAELAAKRLEILRELIPAAARVAVLLTSEPRVAEATLKDVEPAARALGLQLQILSADSSRAIEVAFSTFARERPDALLVSTGPPFIARRVQLVQLATYYKIPAIYAFRQYAEVGGLIAYGTSLVDAYRQVGIYTGRILKGAKPDDLPVVQATKFELVINVETARMLGLTVPPTLLARADEVIE
jgi:ABC-type uncharacterized transport system substrate-binding protein